MRWLAILGVVLGFYYYLLTHVTNTVLSQMQQIQNQYSYVADHADQIAAGR
ncbi:MAG TPA: hypothetical protein VFI84_00510 [Candidatus Saccharimonadales bacterium]|nr:hypothetical protein [Candidatus Saccharimonadales bacterium]